MTIRRAIFGALFCCLVTVGWAASLADQIEEIISNSVTSGYNWTIVVENEDGSVRYYERNPDMTLAPASVTKLYTTSGAYEMFGPDHQFKSEVFHTGSISNGTVSGNINLLVHFDVTWNSHTLNNVREPLNRIATAIRNQGITTVTGSVNVYGVSLYNRGQFDNVRNTAASSLNAETAAAFRSALIDAGVAVQGGSSGQAGFNPPGTLIHTHLSGSVNTRWGIPGDLTGASYTINRISHNPSAEILLRMIAYEATESSILLADGGLAVIDHLAGLGINTTGMTMLDGSGLSHANRFSSNQTIALIRHMSNTYPDTWVPSLTIGCQSGTISSRYCGPDTTGRVRGKTGSLSISIALSGLVDNRHGDERYYFSFIANTSGISQNPTRDVIEASVRLLADREMVPAPKMGSVVNPGTGDSLEVSWPNPGGQELFLLQKSDDGVNFDEGVIVPARYIIESRDDLQTVKNPGDVEFFGEFEPSSENSSATGTTPGAGSLFARPDPTRGDRARFTPSIASGEYEVFVTSFNFASANAPGITVRMEDADGPRDFTFDMVQANTGGRWESLGTMNITHGAGHFVEFDNETQTNLDANARMNPAAVMFVPTSSTFERIVYTDTGLAEGQIRYYRVAGVSRDGEVSRFSPVYSAKVESGQSRLLIIDGNDRWVRQPQPENPGKENHDFVNQVADSVGWRAFDSVDNDLVEAGAFPIGDYDAVIWMLGEESTADETFSTTEQQIVTSYLSNNRGLFVSGAEIGWDLQERGSSADTAFYQNILRADFIEDDAGTYDATPIAGELLEGAGDISFAGTPMNIEFPDEIDPINGSVAILRYSGGTNGNAGLRFQNSNYRLVHFGFPFESINNQSVRAAHLDRILDFIMAPEPPRNLTLSLRVGTIHLAWDAPRDTNLIGYRVYRSNAPNGPFSPIGEMLPVDRLYYSDTAIIPGIVYYYQVVAVDEYDVESRPTETLSEIAPSATRKGDWILYY